MRAVRNHFKTHKNQDVTNRHHLCLVLLINVQLSGVVIKTNYCIVSVIPLLIVIPDLIRNPVFLFLDSRFHGNDSRSVIVKIS